MVAERRVQQSFRFFEAFQLLAYILLFIGAGDYLGRRPNLAQLPPRASGVGFQPVQLGGWESSPLRLHGSWVLTSNDARFGGFSGLAIEGERLLALTDQGAVARIPKPGSGDETMLVAQLPGGPSSADFTWNRDTEALSRDPLGRGWWITFEKANELWLFDPRLQSALKRIELGRSRWPKNLGLEGLVARLGPEILMFPENEDRLLTMRGGRAVAGSVAGRELKISEAVLLPDGRVAGIERGFGLGFQNQLIMLAESAAGWGVTARYPLHVGLLDNVEGVAAEPLPNGGTRLWMISDDNFQRPLRTLLLAVDLPTERQAG